MIKSAFAAIALCWALATTAAMAAEPSAPPGFKTQMIHSPAGAEIFVRSGGAGPAVVLIHGFGDTGDMWTPLAVELAETHTVIGFSIAGTDSHPAFGAANVVAGLSI